MPKKYTQTGLENAVDKLHTKVDEVNDKLADINTTLNRNTDSLELHMKRSDTLETMLKHQELSFEAQIEPIKKHVNMVKGGIKLLGIALTLLSIFKLLDLI
jgi:gamma-glutamylcysteine synthetase